MQAISESGTVRISDRVKKMKDAGIDIISFSIGEPDFPTPAHIVEAGIDALRNGFTKYTPSAGIPELREAIAEKLRRENGIEAKAGEIIVTPAKHAIFMSVMALVERGEEVIIGDPAWVSYEPIVRMCDAVPVRVRADEETGFRFNYDRLNEKISERTRMIVLNYPNNPTGSVGDRREMEDICEIAREKDILILSDEIYEKIIYGREAISPASLADMSERVVTVNGFSKTYSMTGWRIGYLHARGDMFRQIMKVQTHTVTCATSFAQKAGLAALSGPAESVKEMVGEFRKRRDYTVSRLKRMKSLEVIEPEGAFYVFPRYSAEMDSEAMGEYLLENAHVAVTPGSSFGAFGEKHIRISYATGMENLRRGLDAMEEALEKTAST